MKKLAEILLCSTLIDIEIEIKLKLGFAWLCLALLGFARLCLALKFPKIYARS